MLDQKLDFWLQHNLNVLLEGECGTGKSAQILDCFKRNKVKYLYFSAPTMDPFLHLLGIPKEVQTPEGKSYLEFIKPQKLQFDEVEAIFFDECNRAPTRVLNCILEILQFKSVNGEKFKNLRVVWAAINPADEGGKYQVEDLDPAHLDRFQIHYRVPSSPDPFYFRQKFGIELANNALQWWKELPDISQKLVSPRRLDYALEMSQLGGDLRDVLPQGINVTKLAEELANGSITAKLQPLMGSQKVEEARKFLLIENNYSSSIKSILSNSQYTEFFLPLLSEERLVNLLFSNPTVEKFVWRHREKYHTLLDNLFKQGGNKKFLGKIRSRIWKDVIKSIWGSGAKPNFSTHQGKSVCHGVGSLDQFLWAITYCRNIEYSSSDKEHFSFILSLTLPQNLTTDQSKMALEILPRLLIMAKNKAYHNEKIISMLNHVYLACQKNQVEFSLPSSTHKVLKNLTSLPLWPLAQTNS